MFCSRSNTSRSFLRGTANHQKANHAFVLTRRSPSPAQPFTTLPRSLSLPQPPNQPAHRDTTLYSTIAVSLSVDTTTLLQQDASGDHAALAVGRLTGHVHSPNIFGLGRLAGRPRRIRLEGTPHLF